MGVNPWSGVGDRNYLTSCPGRGRTDSVGPGAATGDPKWSRVRGSVARWEQSEHVTQQVEAVSRPGLMGSERL